MDAAASHGFASTPEPPYYAVIFTSQHGDNLDGYESMARHMAELASVQPGFLGIESVRGADGFGITVSYWKSKTAVVAWRRHAEHSLAQDLGRRRWYQHYQVRVARVERDYAGPPAMQSKGT
ncbi:antibiotic biosynthesis monooxygenase family protein [Pseudofulvimonas gallinarii]|uniref:Heme-degrading monooxygenase HmoA n=1 Tax=Pseudofulvimonas gallinarii TaxID=634155 RepID=A0A4R3L067_9GAMM|nr:antibiotic biosynthesis monooxygenase [Pseudofulvimonas gallinarii]TCS92198.1 heme-degrading monooxygenase HmoA [Pseudofulvimonas gallinarii]THD12607.1 hypothetical protein B1808_12150 [Pseudofulvimonas gallinarii]